MSWVDRIPWTVAIVAGVFLGLAPFQPEPHVVEKLRMLFSGTLVRPIDIFDLVLHSIGPTVLMLKIVRLVFRHAD